MKPGRNDPCPCGSGRKYKHCCAARDARSAPVLRLLGADTTTSVLSAASSVIDKPVPWEADLAPMSMGLADDVTARPVALLLAARGQVLCADLIPHPPSDAGGVATLLADAVSDTIARGAVAPSRVRVRHRELMERLRVLLAGRGIKVETVQALPTLDDFAAQLRQQLGGLDEPGPAVSIPDTWAAWALPEAVISRLFDAAANYHAAEPWLVLENEQFLDLVMPDGRQWTASVLGNGGQQFGLVLYERPEDVLAMYETRSPGEVFRHMKSTVLSLSFDRRGDLPKPMQREIARSGWRVNGPDGFPVRWALNTIGGGLSPQHVEDLILALQASVSFARAHARQLADPARRSASIVWMDESNRVTIHYSGFDEVPSLWPPVTLLSPGLPEGDHADANALCREGDDSAARDAEIVARFAAAERAAGSAESRVELDVRNVELFLEAMHGYQGVTAPAVTEYDLRFFLYDWFPRKVRMSRTDANTMRASLRRFSEYLAGREGIRYPWARAILRDKIAFEERWDSFPGGFWWDEGVAEWVNELSDDLTERVMLPAAALAGLGEWGATMGPEEARLHAMLRRQFLQWRDEIIRAGECTPVGVRVAAARRQAEWEQRPQPWLKGKSVSEMVRRERATR